MTKYKMQYVRLSTICLKVVMASWSPRRLLTNKTCW